MQLYSSDFTATVWLVQRPCNRKARQVTRGKFDELLDLKQHVKDIDYARTWSAVFFVLTLTILVNCHTTTHYTSNSANIIPLNTTTPPNFIFTYSQKMSINEPAIVPGCSDVETKCGLTQSNCI